MLSKHPTLVTTLLFSASLALTAIAATPEHDHSHGQKTPAAAPAASLSTEATTNAPTGDGAVAKYDALMQRMREQHQKMMAAKTPAERQNQMSENSKLMQEGMTMMQEMQEQPGKGMAMGSQAGTPQGGMGDCMGMHKQMKMRMDMMEMMMQMLQDQQASGMMQ